MENKALEYLKNYNKSEGYGIEVDDLFETLTESKEVYREDIGDSRWWKNYFIVAEVNWI